MIEPDDIVEALRWHAGNRPIKGLFAKAADEIERLRAGRRPPSRPKGPTHMTSSIDPSTITPIIPLQTLQDVIEVVLLFHTTNRWGTKEQLKWHNLTGSPDATTKSMCDWLRKIQASFVQQNTESNT